VSGAGTAAGTAPERRDGGGSTRAVRLARWLTLEHRWLLVAGLVLGAELRLLVGLSPELGRLDADHAVLYLMARHVGDGDLPAFYWGQEYGGSLLPLLLGAVFLLTGPQLWLLNAAIALSGLLVALLTWRVGVALGRPGAGAVAGALVAVGPPSWVWFTTASDGFYAVGLCFSLGAVLTALRPATARTVAATGVLVGLAVWTSPLSFVTAPPAVLLQLRSCRWSSRRCAAARPCRPGSRRAARSASGSSAR
jgi:hypothetical protein